MRTRLGLALLLAIIVLGACAERAPGPAPVGMVWIPGGEFLMGSDGPFALPHEQPVHRVRLRGFFMDVDAVTNAEYAAFVAATGYVTVAERAPSREEIMRALPAGAAEPPAELLVPGSLVFTPVEGAVDLRDVSRWWKWVPGASWRHPRGPGSDLAGKDSVPVVQVAWEDAVAYAAWRGGRLPTEAEFEYAARGGVQGAEHTWGDAPHDAEHPQAKIYAGAFPEHPAEAVAVGSYAPNGFGLRDMSGNVWQWTADWYAPDTYVRQSAAGVADSPTGADAGSTRVIRGGSFLCSDVYCRGYRVSARGTGAPDTGASHIGFRIVQTPER